MFAGTRRAKRLASCQRALDLGAHNNTQKPSSKPSSMARVAWAARANVLPSEYASSSPLFDPSDPPSPRDPGELGGGSEPSAAHGELENDDNNGEQEEDETNGELEEDDVYQQEDEHDRELDLDWSAEGKISNALWEGAIFYLDQEGHYLKGRPKTGDATVAEYASTRFVAAYGVDTLAVGQLEIAASIRLTTVKERPANTHVKYGADNCHFGHKGSWRKYCHAKEGEPLWGCADVVKRGERHNLLVTSERAADFLRCRSQAFTGKNSGKSSKTQVSSTTVEGAKTGLRDLLEAQKIAYPEMAAKNYCFKNDSTLSNVLHQHSSSECTPQG